MIDLTTTDARIEFLALADPGPMWFAYIEREALAVRELAIRDVVVAVAPCAFMAVAGRRTFEWGEGEPSAIIEMHGPDAARVEDFCAWSINRPHEPATLLGRCGVLGAAALANPASFFGGKVLRCWSTPLEWLKANAEGCVLVDKTNARAHFAHERIGRIQVDDAAHGWELARAARLHRTHIVYEQG